MQDIQYPISGACQCGTITYELLEAPQQVIACHCRECQKLSTSAFSLTALVPREALHVNGALKHWERMSDSDNTNCAKFCPECGNRLYHYNPDKPEIIKLKPCTLADTRIIRPTLHVWVSEKQDWFQIPEDVEQHPTQPW